MKAADKVIRAIFESDEEFQKVFERVLKDDLNLNVNDFSQVSEIPVSTLYKIMSGKRKPNMNTMRQIVTSIRQLDEGQDGDFIAIIAARHVLDNINETRKAIDGKLLTIREYSAYTMEDAIVAAVKAEREGAKALVCAPIVSPTVEKILNIPVATIMPKDSLMDAIEIAAKKVDTQIS
ncbi:transcriptional regulator [Methanosalsum natronophilum]|uniref:Transcriptional regulator n=1 Tax=Methanosalsum natronophilum TaxID=768733 RepID=A0A424Z3L5_9EURY|nr:transcriptional regulator [Methanosalsum natronophilum]RQD89201.1 MAG: transcriptional regulator [Methanosalsum natronophilum]